MAELTESEIIAKIAAIDADIATITDELGSGGKAGAANLDYDMGNKSVDGTGRLTQLREARKVYQDLLQQLPSVKIRHHDYEVGVGTGEKLYEEIGDE